MSTNNPYVIAIAIVGMAIVLMVISVKALKAVKDLSGTAEEFKIKLLPMLDEVTALSKSGRQMLEDSAPKVKIITENLVKASDTLVATSNIARTTLQHIDTTVSDANRRTQRQVARVDGMFTAALDTTAEVVETIAQGIRVPAQKVAVLATQAKCIAEGLIAKFKSMSANKSYRS